MIVYILPDSAKQTLKEVTLLCCAALVFTLTAGVRPTDNKFLFVSI